MTERVKSAIVADGRPPDLGSRISHADPRTVGAGSPDPASLGETAGFGDPALQPAPRKQRLLCGRERQPLDRLGALNLSNGRVDLESAVRCSRLPGNSACFVAASASPS